MNTEEVTHFTHLENIKDKIEKMPKVNQTEILKILSNHKNIKLNENKNGVYINLSFLPNNVIEELDKYIKYFILQEESLNKIEIQKDQFKTTFFREGLTISHD